MLSSVCQFHDGTRACLRTSDSDFLECFEAEQDLRQGCVIAPSLSNTFFATVLHVARLEDGNSMIVMVCRELG